MSWRTLSLKNMVKNGRRYLGYLLSSSVAIMVYFMFAVFVHNPFVTKGYVTSNAAAVFHGCQYIVLLFAVFFIFFFHAALLRLRSREMGMFTVLGMTPLQLARLVFMESILLGVAALIIGGVVGALFSKLFLLAIGSILNLQTEIPFIISKVAILQTLLIFGLLFIVEATFVSIRTARRTAKSLLVVNRKRQKPPKASVIWVIVGISCLAAAYYLAVFHSLNLTMNFLPILIMTTIGTYLLFSQLLVAVLGWLRNRPLSGLSILIVSRLAHRMKDNARVLTVVTLLTAMVLSGMGSVLGTKSIIHQNSENVDPFPIMLMSHPSQPMAVGPTQIRKILNKDKVQVTGQETLQLVSGHIYSVGHNTNYPVAIASASEFERVRQSLHKAQPQLSSMLKPIGAVQPGHAVFVAPYPLVMQTVFTNPAGTVIEGGLKLPVTVDQQSATRIFNSTTAVPGFMLVVSDADYAKIIAAAPSTSKWSAQGFYVSNWQLTQAAVTTLNSMLPKAQQAWLTSTITADVMVKQLLSSMMFAGFLISVLFFLAAGTSMYFRLQVQQEVDKQQFMGLKRIGMQRREIGKLLTIEFLIFFGVPIVAAVVHSVFAMLDFTHLIALKGSAWPVFWGVVAIYAVCMTAYFVVARVRYLKTVA